MLEDLIKGLDNIQRFSNQFDPSKYEEAVRLTTRVFTRKRIRERMLAEAREAIATTPEFQYEPLEMKLLENLMDQRHYVISPDLSFIRVFDEKIAGTADDLIRGQRAGGGGSSKKPQEERLRIWTYGIYKPAREGTDKPKSMMDYPDYSAVIDARLSYWAGKTPYWMFLEFGNQGGAEAYPSFAGTGFIAKVSAAAEEILRETLAEVSRAFLNGTDEAVKDQLANWEDFVPVFLEEVPMPEAEVEGIRAIYAVGKEGRTYLRARGKYGRFVETALLGR